MIHALQGIRLGDRSFLPYFTENSRKKPFSDSDEAICLCGRNKTADQINAAKIAKLPGKARTYQAQIAGDVSAQDKPAPDQLHLKKNVRVIMLQNTDKYRNGSSAIVTSLGNDEITPYLDIFIVTSTPAYKSGGFLLNLTLKSCRSVTISIP